jgi:hypothetical protein
MAYKDKDIIYTRSVHVELVELEPIRLRQFYYKKKYKKCEQRSKLLIKFDLRCLQL